jgi:hypothetical protein
MGIGMGVLADAGEAQGEQQCIDNRLHASRKINGYC